VSNQWWNLARNIPEISEAARQELVDFLDTLDNHDEVHPVFAGRK
jgi:hypothetical protein